LPPRTYQLTVLIEKHPGRDIQRYSQVKRGRVAYCRYHGCQIESLPGELRPLRGAALREEGYLSLDDFALNQYQDISEFAKRVQALPVNRGGVRFGQLHIIKLKAFLYWLMDRQHRGLRLDLDDGGFGKNELEMAVIKYRAKEERKVKEEAAAKVPDKFSPHTLRGWNTFNQELENYLSSIRGASGVPLVYVLQGP